MSATLLTKRTMILNNTFTGRDRQKTLEQITPFIPKDENTARTFWRSTEFKKSENK